MNKQDFNIQKVKEIVHGYGEIEFAAVFGSVVKNRLHKESDIDLAIAGKHSFSSDFIYAFLQDLNGQLTHPADVVDLQAVSGPILQQALCTGIVLKNAAPLLYAGLIKRMWYNQADMMPYTLRVMKSHSQRFING